MKEGVGRGAGRRKGWEGPGDKAYKSCYHPIITLPTPCQAEEGERKGGKGERSKLMEGERERGVR